MMGLRHQGFRCEACGLSVHGGCQLKAHAVFDCVGKKPPQIETPQPSFDEPLVRSRRPLHAIDATRVHLTMKWVVSFFILRPFGPLPVNTMLRAGARFAAGHKVPVGRRRVCRRCGRRCWEIRTASGVGQIARNVGGRRYDDGRLLRALAAFLGVAVPSLPCHDSCPSDDAGGGFFFDFELFRTASRPSRRVRGTAVPRRRRRDPTRVSVVIRTPSDRASRPRRAAQASRSTTSTQTRPKIGWQRNCGTRSVCWMT